MLLSPQHESPAPGGSSLGAVVAGEIHNRARLWRLLGDDGPAAKERSDDDLVAALYERFGPDLVAAIDGSFALAVFDGRDGTTLLARDRFGERPLHYAATPSGPVAATRPGDLIAAGAVSGDLDRAAVSRFLAAGASAPEESLLAGAAVLAPGHLGIWRGDAEPQIRRYWQPPAPTGGGLETEAERIEELSGLLRGTIGRRRAGGARTGVLVTGVGAALVAAFAAADGEPLAAITDVDLDRAALPARAAMLLKRPDRPLADPLAPIVLGLGDLAAAAFDVALAGIGADAFGRAGAGAGEGPRLAAWSAAPLPVRSPYLNLEVAEFAATTGALAERGERSPLEQLLREAGGTPPPEPRPAPVAEWLRGPLAEAAHTRLESGPAAAAGLFYAEDARAKLDRHLAGTDVAADLWPLFVLDAWLEGLGEES